MELFVVFAALQWLLLMSIFVNDPKWTIWFVCSVHNWFLWWKILKCHVYIDSFTYMYDCIRVRHCYSTKYLLQVNKILIDEQKATIKATPFGWLVMIDKQLKMSRRVVRELSYRFVEKECGFQIRSDVVSLSLIDVCVGIGLRIGGEKVDLKKDSSDSTLRSLFASNCVIIPMIYDELLKHVNDCNVVEFCKLYILLALSEFFLPSTKGSVCSLSLIHIWRCRRRG